MFYRLFKKSFNNCFCFLLSADKEKLKVICVSTKKRFIKSQQLVQRSVINLCKLYQFLILGAGNIIFPIAYIRLMYS